MARRWAWGNYNGQFTTAEGRSIALRRRGNRCRFYDRDNGVQVGPEQPHVAAAIAYAMTRGWRS